MTDLLSRLRAGEVLVADGAMGTLLFDHGLPPGECPESLNLADPVRLEQVARLYVDAGADLVQTNTFGGSPLALARYDLDGQTDAINAAAVAAVRRVVGTRAYVSGSCGPSRRTLLPYGDTAPEEVYASFERQVRALIEAGVDVLCIETMTDLREAQLAVRAARAVSATIPVMATMTFDATPRGFFTIMGTDIRTAAAGLAEAGANIVGSNCGNGSEHMVAVAREFRARTDLPLLIQANAGLPQAVGDRVVYAETPAFMAQHAQVLIDLGVSIVGGCCGTTPEHIRAIRKAVDQRRTPLSRMPFS
jgi:5-methyltetrahydrofolate--homocysteine methyltransferase